MPLQTSRLSLFDGGDHRQAVSPALQTLTQGVQRPRDAVDVRRKSVCNYEDPHWQGKDDGE